MVQTQTVQQSQEPTTQINIKGPMKELGSKWKYKLASDKFMSGNNILKEKEKL